MTNEQWNTLTSLTGWVEQWTKYKMCRTTGSQKLQVNWLSGEFGLPPVDWGCKGCIISRIETFDRILTKENEIRSKQTT